MKHKRQFAGTSKPRTFYDRKVRTEGFSRVLSMTKIIPKTWQYVRITPIGQEEDNIILSIQRLLGVNNSAPTTKSGSESKQNTP